MPDVIRRIPRISEHITTRFLGDEAFIMNLKSVKTYSLNETAARIWSLIDGTMTVDEITQNILTEYDIPGNLCKDAVIEMIDRFSAEKLVIFVAPHD